MNWPERVLRRKSPGPLQKIVQNADSSFQRTGPDPAGLLQSLPQARNASLGKQNFLYPLSGSSGDHHPDGIGPHVNHADFSDIQL